MIRWYTLEKDQVSVWFLHLIQHWPHRLPYWMMYIPDYRWGYRILPMVECQAWCMLRS